MRILKIKDWLRERERNNKFSSHGTVLDIRKEVARQYKGLVSDEWIDKYILNK